MAFLPFLLGAAGAGFGALTHPKHPWLGAMGGAAMGGLGGAGLGALGAGAGAAGAAGAAGGAGDLMGALGGASAGVPGMATVGSASGLAGLGGASQGLGMLGNAQKMANIFSTLRGQPQPPMPQDNYMAMPTPIPPMQAPQSGGSIPPVQTSSSMFPQSNPFPGQWPGNGYGGGFR